MAAKGVGRVGLDNGPPRMDPKCRMKFYNQCRVYNPWAYSWKTRAPFTRPRRVKIYELHVPSFAGYAGTLDRAAAKLPYLKSLGVTYVELMPVADFAVSAIIPPLPFVPSRWSLTVRGP